MLKKLQRVIDWRTEGSIFRPEKLIESGASKTRESCDKFLELTEALLEPSVAETKSHVERLEEIAEIVGKKLTGKTCVELQGVLEEGSEVLEDTDKGNVPDAALIAASQRVEQRKHDQSKVHKTNYEETPDRRGAFLKRETRHPMVRIRRLVFGEVGRLASGCSVTITEHKTRPTKRLS